MLFKREQNFWHSRLGIPVFSQSCSAPKLPAHNPWRDLDWWDLWKSLFCCLLSSKRGSFKEIFLCLGSKKQKQKQTHTHPQKKEFSVKKKFHRLFSCNFHRKKSSSPALILWGLAWFCFWGFFFSASQYFQASKSYPGEDSHEQPSWIILRKQLELCRGRFGLGIRRKFFLQRLGTGTGSPGNHQSPKAARTQGMFVKQSQTQGGIFWDALWRAWSGILPSGTFYGSRIHTPICVIPNLPQTFLGII